MAANIINTVDSQNEGEAKLLLSLSSTFEFYQLWCHLIKTTNKFKLNYLTFPQINPETR